MPEGKEIGKAYVTVNLNDATDADYAALKAGIESRGDINLGTTLKLPDAADFERIKAVTEAKGDIKIPVKLDTNQAEQGLKSLGDTSDQQSNRARSSVGGMLTSTGAAWTALGALLAGPAVSLALGVVAGGFAAIGIAAEKSNPQVTQAFNTMKTQGVDVLQASFQSLNPVIVGSLNQWTNGIRGLGPQFAQISSEIAPGMGIISNAILKAAQTDMPAFTSALSQATPMARSLAGGIQDLSNGFAQFLGRLNFSEADAGLSALLRDVGGLLPAFASLLNAVMPLGNALLSSVVPAATTLITTLSNGLAPALRLIGSTISALGPVLNFMAGPTAAVLTGVVAFKSLQSATNTLLPVFNSVSQAVSTYGSKIVSMVGGSDSAIGSFTVLTDAAKKQAVQAAASALTTAQQTAAQAANNLATVESAAAADASSVSQEQLVAARAAATAATVAETEATASLNVASEASSFAFGPVGIGLSALAGLMMLFAGNTDHATPATQNFTSALNQLAAAAPGAQKGIIEQNPGLADLINKLQAAGVSVKDYTDAANGSVDAQNRVKAALTAAAAAAGSNGQAIDKLADPNQKFGDQMSQIDPKLRAIVDLYKAYSSSLGENAANQAAANAVGTAGAGVVKLTSTQQAEASTIAKSFGLSVGDVTSAFQRIPGAGVEAGGAVDQVAGQFVTAQLKMANAEQAITDYFTQLKQNATQANQALANANHSYEQSITSVTDAQRSYAQSQQAVVTADQGVVTAQRAVTDAQNAYGQSQRAVASAQQSVIDADNGVITAEHSLAQAQYSEQQAQVSLTQARHDAVEQLKSLQLQLNDQVASEQQAKLRLFDQTRTAAAQGITPDNASSILDAPITQSNEAQKQAALDLVSAENSLADTMNTGVTLRQKVNTANQQGVEGNPAVVSAVHALQNAQDQVTASEQALLKAHQQVDNAVNALQQAYYNLGKAQQAIVDAQSGVVKAQQAVSDAVYNETKARQGVRDAIYNEQQALQAVRDAQIAATKANELNSGSLDLNTQAGRNNYAQLQTLFAAYPPWMTQNDRFKAMIDDTATAFGISRDRAQEYLTKLGLINPNFKYNITAVAGIDAGAWVEFLGGFKIGGFLSSIGFAEGGHVRGPGGPKADQINAKLSNNEFVQPSDAVDHYGVPFMQAVQQKKLPKGGDGASLPGFASGGLVGSSVAAGLGAAVYQADVTAETVMGFPHPPGLPAYVPPAPSVGGMIGYNASAGVAQWAPLILQALAALGQPASWLGTVERRMQQESSGNPNSINTWDSNAAAGHPSKGLMQTIQSTFDAYRNPAWSANIYDPLNNIYAGLNWAIRHYGSLSALNRPGGYDNGGFMLDAPALNSTGKPEMILPPNLTDTVMSLHEMVQSLKSNGAGGGGTSVHVNVATMPMDPHETAEVTARELAWALR